jgi:hypothetical protein
MEQTRDDLKIEVRKLMACFLALLTQPQSKFRAFTRAVIALETRVRQWIIQLALKRYDPYPDDLVEPDITEAEPVGSFGPIERPKRTYALREPRKPELNKDPIELARLAHWLARLRSIVAILENPDRAVDFVRPHLNVSLYPFTLPYDPEKEARIAAMIERTCGKPDPSPEDPAFDLVKLLAPFIRPPDSS